MDREAKKASGMIFLRNFIENNYFQYVIVKEYENALFVLKKMDVMLHISHNQSAFQPMSANKPKEVKLPIILSLTTDSEKEIYKMNAFGVEVLISSDHNELIKKLQSYEI